MNIPPVLLNSRLFRALTLLKARCYDIMLGIETVAYSADSTQSRGALQDSANYQPTPYGVLESISRYLRLGADDIFVDLGCGKGRAVFFFSLQRLEKVIGVEFDDELLALANKNLQNFRFHRSLIEFVRIDAGCDELPEASVYFMFNPFGPKTMDAVASSIKRSWLKAPRRVRIIYYNPVYRAVLDAQDWLERAGQIGDRFCLVWPSKAV